MQKGRTGRFTMHNGELIKSTLIVIFWVQKNFCNIGSWYLKNDIPRTSRTIAKVNNILKELATLST